MAFGITVVEPEPCFGPKVKARSAGISRSDKECPGAHQLTASPTPLGVASGTGHSQPPPSQGKCVNEDIDTEPRIGYRL